jgi:hypothetical protein
MRIGGILPGSTPSRNRPRSPSIDPGFRQESRFEKSGQAARSRRRYAATGPWTVSFGAAAMRPADAHATALKDNCTILATNKTGSQGNVRPIVYTPLLPTSPASIALYAARAVTGIQTNGFDAFTNYGTIVPSWG